MQAETCASAAAVVVATTGTRADAAIVVASRREAGVRRSSARDLEGPCSAEVMNATSAVQREALRREARGLSAKILRDEAGLPELRAMGSSRVLVRRYRETEVAIESNRALLTAIGWEVAVVDACGRVDLDVEHRAYAAAEQAAILWAQKQETVRRRDAQLAQLNAQLKRLEAQTVRAETDARSHFLKKTSRVVVFSFF